MRLLCLAGSIAGLVTLASPPARAQHSDTLSAAERTGFALARLRVGQRVRIRARGTGLVHGWIGSSPNLVTLRTGIEVPAAGVDSLWVRGGSHAGIGALIGGAVVGIGLGAVAQGFSHFEGGCNHPPSRCGAAPFFLGLVIGGTGGALLGTLIGGPPAVRFWGNGPRPPWPRLRPICSFGRHSVARSVARCSSRWASAPRPRPPASLRPDR